MHDEIEGQHWVYVNLLPLHVLLFPSLLLHLLCLFSVNKSSE